MNSHEKENFSSVLASRPNVGRKTKRETLQSAKEKHFKPKEILVKKEKKVAHSGKESI